MNHGIKETKLTRTLSHVLSAKYPKCRRGSQIRNIPYLHTQTNRKTTSYDHVTKASLAKRLINGLTGLIMFVKQVMSCRNVIS